MQYPHWTQNAERDVYGVDILRTSPKNHHGNVLKQMQHSSKIMIYVIEHRDLSSLYITSYYKYRAQNAIFTAYNWAQPRDSTTQPHNLLPMPPAQALDSHAVL
jgi:hypothetical protein